MSKEVAKTVMQAGLISGDAVQELHRWGAPLPPTPPGPEMPAEVVPLAIERAIQKEDFVQIRETDLSVIKLYLKNHHEADLHIVDDDGNETVAPITYCVNALGEYAIPWDGDNITDIMSNGQTYLLPKAENGTSPDKIRFRTARELFYGEQKMFIVCAPARTV